MEQFRQHEQALYSKCVAWVLLLKRGALIISKEADTEREVMNNKVCDFGDHELNSWIRNYSAIYIRIQNFTDTACLSNKYMYIELNLGNKKISLFSVYVSKCHSELQLFHLYDCFLASHSPTFVAVSVLSCPFVVATPHTLCHWWWTRS